jgi:flagellin
MGGPFVALSIVNNVSSLTAQQNLNKTGSALSQSLSRLSTGLKVNRGADGPAALVISQQQRSQIAGLTAAISNTNRAVSIVQTGEGALNQINSLLTQVRGLAVDSANTGVNSQEALAANQAQIDSALASIDQIAGSTSFGNKKLLDGSTTISSEGGDLALPQVSTATLGTSALSGGTTATGDSASSGSTSSAAQNSLASIASGGANSNNPTAAIKIVDQAIRQVSSLRGSMGAFQANALQANANNLRESLENTTAAESTVRDTDFASEMANLTKNQVLMQAGSTVLSNANQTSQLVLGLLRG